ncbi:hypothetical protein ACW17M_06915 [Vreelandella sp. 2A-K22]
MSQNAIKQALEAFVAEANLAGYDIKEIAQEATAGIMSNKIYSWISTTEKTKAAKALEDAVEEILKHSA